MTELDHPGARTLSRLDALQSPVDLYAFIMASYRAVWMVFEVSSLPAGRYAAPWRSNVRGLTRGDRLEVRCHEILDNLPNIDNGTHAQILSPSSETSWQTEQAKAKGPTMSVAADRAQIDLQEKELLFSRFDYATAWSLGTSLRRLAEERSLPVVIDVRKFGDPFQLLFHTALPGTNPDNLRWVERKAKIVSRFHRSSYSVGLSLQEKGITFTEKYSLPDADYATHGGAFPITLFGAGIFGAVTVSGLPMRADHELAVEGICRELKLEYADFRLD